MGAEVTAGAGDNAIEAVEAALARPFFLAVVAEVPFAGHVGVIACGLEDFGERDAVTVEKAGITGCGVGGGGLAGVFGEDTYSGLVLEEAGEQGGPGGGAACGVVELSEAEAAGGERINVGCGDFPAVAADIGEAHVVGKDEEDIGTWVLGCGGKPWGGEEAGEDECGGEQGIHEV